MVQHATALYLTVPHQTIQSHIGPNSTVSYCTIPSSGISHQTVPYRATPYRTLLHGTVPHLTVSYQIVQNRIVPGHPAPYPIEPYHIAPNRTVPYRTVPYHIVPHVTVPYYTDCTARHRSLPYHMVPYRSISYRTGRPHTFGSVALHEKIISCGHSIESHVCRGGCDISIARETGRVVRTYVSPAPYGPRRSSYGVCLRHAPESGPAPSPPCRTLECFLACLRRPPCCFVSFRFVSVLLL